MVHLRSKRRGSHDRLRSSDRRWAGWLETLESRIALSNGLVGVPAEFLNPTHIVAVTSVPEDPGNTGVVPSTLVTAVGSVENPLGGPINSIHTTLQIHAFESGTDLGSVSWNVTAGPGTITGPSYLGQDPTAQNRALFSLPFTLLSSSLAPQTVTFQIVAVGFGNRDVVLQSNTSQKLTGTFVVNPNLPPMVAVISPIASPRTDPVSSVDVSFTKAIDPTTFTTEDLTLTRDGAPVSLDPNVVTFSTSDKVNYTIGGLASSTSTFGSYRLTISAAGVKDLNGNQGTGSQSVDFVVQAPVVDTGPQVVGLYRFGYHTQPPLLVLTFSSQLTPARAVNPNNYHVYAAGRDGRLGTADDVPVPLMSGIYNSANKTVTLVMAKPLSVFQRYRIVVKGTGPTPITDLNGVALDGKANGKPGSDFTTVFGREILVVSPPTATPKKNPASVSGKGRYRSYQLGNS